MEGSLPEWAQTASVVAIALVSTIVAVFKYLKTEAGKVVEKTPAVSSAETAAVVAASFIDSRVLRELIDTLRLHQEEFSREGIKNRRSSQELRETIQENTEAIQVGTDTSLNFLKFVKGRDRQRDLEEL